MVNSAITSAAERLKVLYQPRYVAGERRGDEGVALVRDPVDAQDPVHSGVVGALVRLAEPAVDGDLPDVLGEVGVALARGSA